MESASRAMSDSPLEGRPRWTKSGSFQAKIGSRWVDFKKEYSDLLNEAYVSGVPSMRLIIQSVIYKFDFEKMEQKNLHTTEVCQLRAPHDASRPTRKKTAKFSASDLSPAGFKAKLKRMSARGSLVGSQRPVYVVRVPEGSPGTTIVVPHPKILGQKLPVAVPREAKAGQPLFLPVPRTTASSKVKLQCAAAGAGGAAAATAAVLVTDTAIGSGAAAGAVGVGAGVAGLSTAAPVLIPAVATAGALTAAAVGVHYATRHPKKAAAIGALTIAGLALGDHVAEHGVTATVAAAAEGAGDLVEEVIETGEVIADKAVDLVEDAMDAMDGVKDTAHAVDPAPDGMAEFFEVDAADTLDGADDFVDVISVGDAADFVDDLFAEDASDAFLDLF